MKITQFKLKIIEECYLTLHKDIRVILIKTADRLHNMRTIDFLSKAKQDQMASESLYIYAPI